MIYEKIDITEAYLGRLGYLRCYSNNRFRVYALIDNMVLKESSATVILIC